MKKITFLLLLTMSLFVLNGCSEDDSVRVSEINYVSFEAETYSFGVDIDSNNSRDIKVYAGTVSSSDRTFDIMVADATTADPASYTVPATVTIPGGSNEGSFTVNVADVNIGAAGKTLVLSLARTDGLNTSKNIVLNLQQVCPTNDLLLTITFDQYPEETSWQLVDSNMNVVDMVAEGDYDGMTTATRSFCIPNGTYTFTIYDFYADGICCTYGNGSYKLTVVGAAEPIKQGGTFGASESTTFTL